MPAEWAEMRETLDFLGAFNSLTLDVGGVVEQMRGLNSSAR